MASNLIEKMAKEYLLTTEGEYVWVLPSEMGFSTYPLPEDKSGCIKVTKDEYLGLLLGQYTFDETLTKVVDYIPSEEDYSVISEDKEAEEITGDAVNNDGETGAEPEEITSTNVNNESVSGTKLQ